MNGIEVYLRHSDGRALLMLHVPSCMRAQFLQAGQDRVVDGQGLPISFEAPVLPEWRADDVGFTHMGMQIDQITIQYHEA